MNQVKSSFLDYLQNFGAYVNIYHNIPHRPYHLHYVISLNLKSHDSITNCITSHDVSYNIVYHFTSYLMVIPQIMPYDHKYHHHHLHHNISNYTTSDINPSFHLRLYHFTSHIASYYVAPYHIIKSYHKIIKYDIIPSSIPFLSCITQY